MQLRRKEYSFCKNICQGPLFVFKSGGYRISPRLNTRINSLICNLLGKSSLIFADLEKPCYSIWQKGYLQCTLSGILDSTIWTFFSYVPLSKLLRASSICTAQNWKIYVWCSAHVNNRFYILQLNTVL